MRGRTLLGILVVALALASCGVIPYRTARNEAGCPDRQAEGPEAHNPCVRELMSGQLSSEHRVPRGREPSSLPATQTCPPPLLA